MRSHRESIGAGSSRLSSGGGLALEDTEALEADCRPDAPAKTWPEVGRRSRIDRRARATRAWDALLRDGRRAIGRRAGEQARSYVDVYRRRDVLLVVGTFLLNILDAFLTLRWLSLGGVEENPVMDTLLQSGDVVFLAQKCFVVGGLLVVLVVHRNFTLARLGLWLLFFVYAALLGYHWRLQG